MAGARPRRAARGRGVRLRRALRRRRTTTRASTSPRSTRCATGRSWGRTSTRRSRPASTSCCRDCPCCRATASRGSASRSCSSRSLGLVAAYAIGRKLAGGWGASAQPALLAITAPWPVQAARVQADTASVALALCAVAVAFYAGRCPWRWAAVGVLAGAAISVKLLAFPWSRRWPCCSSPAARGAPRPRRVAGARRRLGRAAHRLRGRARRALGVRRLRPPRRPRTRAGLLADNVERVFLHPLDWRTPAAVLVLFGLAAAVVLLRGWSCSRSAHGSPCRRCSSSPSSRCSTTTSCCSRPRSQCPPAQDSARTSSRATDAERSPSSGLRRVAFAVAIIQEQDRLWRPGRRPAGRHVGRRSASTLRTSRRARRHRPPHRRVPRRPPRARAARRHVVRSPGHRIADRCRDSRRA